MTRTRIGMLTPSSNTVLEPTVASLLSGQRETTAHFQRVAVKEISLSEHALDQFADEAMLAAADMLNDAKMHVIAWAGTSAGWRGFDRDAILCRAIVDRTGVAATTSVLAINEILARTDVSRLGLVTPYLGDVQTRIMASYAAAGHPVVSERHLDDRGNFSFAQYTEDQIGGLIRQVATEGVDAVVVLCTNFRGAAIAGKLEAETGVPIYDSISATVWKSLLLAGRDPSSITGWGRLFQLR